MPTIVCPNCGERYSLDEPRCPLCGVEPRHAGTPEVWPPAPVRRVALVSGAAIALLILVALAWLVATGRRTVLGRPDPVIPSAVGDR